MLGFRANALGLIGVLCLVFDAPLGYAAGPITYAEIGNKLISSYGLIDPQEGTTDRIVDEYGIPQLTIQEQRKLIFNILGFAESHDSPAKDKEYIYQAQHSLLEDLEFFYANAQDAHDKHLFSKFNYTESLFGEAVLAKLIATPTTDSAFLRKRQAFIAELVNNETLFNEVQELILAIKKTEPALLSFWVGDESGTQKVIESFYFGDVVGHDKKARRNGWNKDPRALELLARWNCFWTLEPVARDIFRDAIMIYIGNKYIIGRVTGNDTAYNASLWASFLESLFMVVPVTDIHHYIKLSNGSMNALEYSDYKKWVVKPDERANSALWTDEYKLGPARKDALYNALGKLYFFSRRIDYIKQVWHEMVHIRETYKSMQTKLIDVAACVENSQKIVKLGHAHSVVVDGLHYYSSFDDVCSKAAHSKEYAELIDLLQTPTFKGQASFMSYLGRVARAYDLMRRKNNEFAPLLQAYGELDACLSMAKLIKKFNNQPVGYCFVEYVEDASAYLKLEEFWNPQVNPAIVVPNNLELGAAGKARNMILTGSNTGGKSTLLKAVIINLQLGLTFGVVPARMAIMSPFAYIGTSLNIVDNTAEGKSLYQAEVDRATGLIKAAQQLQQEGLPCFLVMDELFRGTGPEKADQETYQCAKDLARYATTSYILATHFVKNPTRLELETAGTCKNYKVEVYTDNQGRLVRPFKLEEGISSQNVAGAILDSGLAH